MAKQSTRILSILFSFSIGILILVFLFGTQLPVRSLVALPQEPASTVGNNSITAQSSALFDDVESHHWIGESDWADDITIDWVQFDGNNVLQAVISNTGNSWASMRTDGFPAENWDGWLGLKADIYQEGGVPGVDVKLEVRGPAFDPPDDIESIYCENVALNNWTTCFWYFKTVSTTADYSQVSHLSVVFDHLNNQSPTFYVDNITLFDSDTPGTDEIWDDMNDGSRQWFYFGNWYNWLAITPTFGIDLVSHNGSNPASQAGAIYLEWNYSNGQDPRHPKAEIGTKNLADFPDWSNYNRVIADVKVSDSNAPISIFFWDEDTKTGHNTSSNQVEVEDEWQTLIWNIYWPPGFDNTNLDEFKFIIGDIDNYPIGNIYIDDIRLFSLDCEVLIVSDSGSDSLRDCIEKAQPDDYIGFNPTIFPNGSPTTITLSSELPNIITNGLTIDGTGANVILDGSGLQDGLSILGANSVTIQDINIKNFSGNGIRIADGSQNNVIGPGNSISLNGNGINIDGITTVSNTITANSIFDNSGEGISLTNGSNDNVAVPTLTEASERTIFGQGPPNAIVEIFSDDGFQGKIFEGAATSDNSGNWSFHKNIDFIAPKLTATATDINGNTSEFSPPIDKTILPAWTIMVYLNGDNDLDYYTSEAFNKLELAAYNQEIEILVLWDRRGINDTNLYLVQPDSNLNELASYTLGVNKWDKGELDMGAPTTLSDFINEVRIAYPAENYFLAIVDHGGGWSAKLPPDQARTRWFLGGSGLSWDETDDFHYLSTYDMKNIFDEVALQGGPIDIVFYDACLMGMVEEAYQIRENANYLIASENESWATFAYDAYLQNVGQNTSAEEFASQIVNEYHDSLIGFPRTMAVIDLTQLDGLAVKLDNLASSLIASYPSSKTVVMTDTFTITQRFDYNFDLILTPEDGYVDLYNFAENLIAKMPGTNVAIDAQALIDALVDPQNPVIVYEKHQSNFMWINSEYINLDNSHGLSIYLPFGENDSHLQYYLESQLELADDTLWNDFIFTYLDTPALPPIIPDDDKPNTTPLPIPEVPVISSSAITEVGIGQSYTYTVKATGYPTPTYALTTAPAGMEIGATSGEILWTPTTSGEFNISVEASNSVGNDSQSFILIVTEAPTITSSPIVEVKIGQPYSYTVTTTGYPPSTYTLSAAPTNMTINSDTGIISWIPEEDGVFSVTVEAVSLAGMDVQSFDITVSKFAVFLPMIMK